MSESDSGRLDEEPTPAKLFEDAVEEFVWGEALGKEVKMPGLGGLGDRSGELKPGQYRLTVWMALEAAFLAKGVVGSLPEDTGQDEDWKAIARALLAALGPPLDQLAHDVGALAELPKSIPKDRETAMKVLRAVAKECRFPYTAPRDPAL